jgi:hypothetical protein
MRHIFLLSTLFLLLTVNIFCQSEPEYKKPKYKRVTEAYGFLKGQNYSLDIIKQKYPELELNIFRVKNLFNSTFGSCEEKIINYLKDFFSEEKFIEFESKLKEELPNIIQILDFTKETSIDFIVEVENRAKGLISSPVLETLLSFKYSDYPQLEFIDGFVNVYKTKDHPKAKGTDWQIKVPKSWKKAEADRPNIIQKFTSDFGDGSQNIMISVHNLGFSDEVTLTNDEINEFFNENEIKNMLPEGAKFISFSKTKIEDLIVGVFEIEKTSERLDTKIKIRMIQYMFVVKNKMYSLEAMVSSNDPNKDLAFDMKKYLPLFKSVVNSIVVNSKYR